MGVQIIKTVITRRGHHEVAARVSDHPLKIAIVVLTALADQTHHQTNSVIAAL
jgi:hypothetical protein